MSYWIQYNQIAPEKHDEFPNREKLQEFVVKELKVNVSDCETMNDFVETCYEKGYIIWRGKYPEKNNPVTFQ